ncbi:hypothetical protein GCM10023238_20810 [Streptomyces heliomycini]
MGKRAAAAEVLVVPRRTGVVLGGVTFVPGPGPMADIAEPGEAEIRMLAVARAGRDGAPGRRWCAPAWTGRGPSRGAGGSCCRPRHHARRPPRLRAARFHPHPRARLEPSAELDDITLLTYELTL